MTVVAHSAVPVPYSQRRMLASVSLNFVLLAGYQFARNLFFGVSMYKPCVTMKDVLEGWECDRTRSAARVEPSKFLHEHLEIDGMRVISSANDLIRAVLSKKFKKHYL
ncbi:hypothetical protein ANCDUO_13626 [Ancylostoma duodenale]|uniref:Uncharacterized protein n=1 Tax=Ancylostoma duodenale TaxID=51022 RepID=A0A0C2GBA9_9BILA|nr:hypothetical protein ANCDUO_13626 [Ancylostoma duodenale]